MLRVPDGLEGKSCQCPACNSVSTVPRQKKKTLTDNSISLSIDDGLIRVTCPRCQYPLRCKSELKGAKGQCKQCKHIFVIGGSSSLNAEAPSLIFSCPKCNQLFDGKPEMEGRKGKCHACGDVFPIQLRQTEVERQPNITASEKPSAIDSTVIRNSASIHLKCGNCQGTMEVPSTAKGETTVCPYCQKRLKIPTPASSGQAAAKVNRQQAKTVQPDNTKKNNVSASTLINPFEFGSGTKVDNSSMSNSLDAYGSTANSSMASYLPAPYYPGYANNTPTGPASNYHVSTAIAPQQQTLVMLRSIAMWYRFVVSSFTLLLLLIFIGVTSIVAMMVMASNGFGVEAMYIPHSGFLLSIVLYIPTVVLFNISYLVLCAKVHEGSTAALFIVGHLAGGVFIVLPLILMILTVQKTLKIFKSQGIPTGFFGADTSYL